MRIERRIGQPRTTLVLPKIMWVDLLYVLASTIGLLTLLTFAEQVAYLRPLRIVLGMAYVLFVPGYCLTAALLPRASDLDLAERIGISFGLSIALVPLLAVVLDRLAWGFQLWPIVWSELIVIGGSMLIAFTRRIIIAGQATHQDRLHQESAPQKSAPQYQRSLERRAYLFMALALITAALCAAWVVLVPSPDSYMTEFYILGKNGLAEDFPGQTSPAEAIGVTIGIVNRERTSRRYHVEVWVTDAWNRDRRMMVQQAGPYELAVSEAGRWPLSWQMPWVGNDQQVELLLFVDQQPEPYRRLLLWMDVKEGSH